MKKAPIILSMIALFSVAGGALAFKAAKFCGNRAFTFTNGYITFGTVYTAAAAACLPINPFRCITTFGPAPTTVYSSTGTTTTAPVTLTQVGGTGIITFPAYTCSLIEHTFTTVIN